ncbi:hypothetical protein EC912_10713 [Luteibacter rhizovicinus]|uniref:Transmembrane protein n=1 Tax=Luteibacter rhizovicinus TaxID=242606 RepID=A0A4R3YLH9_9GAMM|nr:hypothetical protein [Luteibacter rhizovicinus]TCV92308.1 hypothetical protein EC912_10713 [Luteibacter rhizovicinus]
MRAVHKRYLREFIPAMVGYVVLIFGSVWMLKRVDTGWLRAAITLLPIIPIAFVIRAMVRVIRDQDELERRIDLEAIAIAGALSGFGFFSYGLLLNAGTLPAPPAEAVAIWVMPVLMGTFGIVKCGMSQYYRRR